MRERHGWRYGSDEACSIPLVIAYSVDINAIGHGAGVNFKEHRLANVHANIRGKSLYVARACSRDIPLTRSIARQTILRLNRICRSIACGKG